MVRVIAYIRVSTDRQATDGTSLTTQRRRVVEHVAAKGYRLVKQFVEEGESAKTDNRPVLREMLAYCQKEQGNIDLLVIPKIDRFARYTEDYHHLKRQLRELGIRVESIDERFDDSPAGRFLESMLAATAQFDNDVRSERTYNGMKEAVSQGRWVFKAPFGFRNTRAYGKATIEPDPDTAHLVVEIFERVAKGTSSIPEIGDWLSAQGVRIGKTALYRLVRNRTYLGVIEAFGLSVRAEPPCVPILSEALFHRAQEGLRRMEMPDTILRENPDFPLRGTVRCPCGKALTAAWSHGRSARYAYYRCRSCSRVNLRREQVEDAFATMLGKLETQMLITEATIKSLREESDRDQALIEARRQNHRKELDRLVRLQKALLMKSVEGIIPDHLASEQMLEFETKLRDVRQRLSESESKAVEPPFDVVLKFSRNFLQQVRFSWLKATYEEKQRIQRALFPHGARLTEDCLRRTAKEPRFTGSEPFLFTQSSALVAQSDESANHGPKDSDRKVGAEIELLRRIHREFGRTDG